MPEWRSQDFCERHRALPGLTRNGRCRGPGEAGCGGYIPGVQAARLAEVAQQLYSLPPGSFREARDERAGQARTEGDRELARAIGKLRRPTVTAWLVNQLVREAGDQLGELLDLGAQLREAQSALAGTTMRELSGRRRELVSALTRAAQRLAREAGQAVSEQTERELAATLEAALADPAAAEAVGSGRLTTALSYAGLGGIDIGDVVAAGGPAGAEPGRRKAGRREGGRAKGKRPADGGKAARRALAEAQTAVRKAESAVREAEEILTGAEEQAAASTARHDATRRRIEELESELDEARTAEGHAARVAKEARRDRDSADRALVTARRQLIRARERADRAAALDGTGTG